MPAQLLIGLTLLAVTLSSMMIWFLDSYERLIAPFLSQWLSLLDGKRHLTRRKLIEPSLAWSHAVGLEPNPISQPE